MSATNDLKQKMDRLSTQMNDLMKPIKAANRIWTSAEREKYIRMGDEYDGLEEQYKAHMEQEGSGLPGRLAAAAGGTGAVNISEFDVAELRQNFHLSAAQKRQRENDKNPHAKAFSSRLRHANHMPELDPDGFAVLNGIMGGHGSQYGVLRPMDTMSTTVGSQGGDIIPQGFSNQLEEAKKWFGGIDGTVERFATSTGNTMPWPTVNDTTNRGVILNQNTQVVEQDLVFGTVSFSAFIMSSQLILIPLALVEDSYFDLDALVAKLLGIRLGRGYNFYCTVGTGTNQPTGIVPAAVASGNVLTLGSGNTSTISYANLVNLQHSVDPAYRENPSSKWMFSDAVLKLLKLLVDGNNRPLWQPGIYSSFETGATVMGSRPTILGNSYVINQDMATPAANAYSMLFGDLSTFKVREVAGGTTVLVLRERYADYLQNGYTAFQRVDSNLVNAGTNPIGVLQQSSS